MLELIVMGNLGRDPEMRYTPSGQAVTNISVPSTRKWTAQDGTKKEETTWVKASFWGKRAEIVNNYFKKGDPILVKGYLKPEIAIFDRQDGTKGASYEMTATDFHFCGKTSGTGPDQDQTNTEVPGEDEIPF